MCMDIVLGGQSCGAGIGGCVVGTTCVSKGNNPNNAKCVKNGFEGDDTDDDDANQ